MQEELSNAAKKATKTAKNVANKVEDNLDVESSVTSDARETLNKFTGSVSDMASDYLGAFNSSPLGFVRQYPVQAAIGGVILGFILGAAVSKKSVTE